MKSNKKIYIAVCISSLVLGIGVYIKHRYNKKKKIVTFPAKPIENLENKIKLSLEEEFENSCNNLKNITSLDNQTQLKFYGNINWFQYIKF